MTVHFTTRLRRGGRRRRAGQALRTCERAWAAVTAQEIVDRIKKSIGVDWSSDDVDTFKTGDPSTVVTGVVTTSMATLEVLQKAVQAGANFVITAAPTFYSRADLSTPAGRGFGAGAPAAASSGARRRSRSRRRRPARRAPAGRAPAPRRRCRRRPRCRRRSCRRRSRPPRRLRPRLRRRIPSSPARTTSSRNTSWWCSG